MTVLPDTSVWVDYLRRGRSGASWALDGLLANNQVVLCGPVLAELMAGAGASQRSELWALLSGLTWSDIDRMQWRHTGDVAGALRERGETVPLTDVEIAVAAVAAGAQLWTRDADFHRIASVLEELQIREA